MQTSVCIQIITGRQEAMCFVVVFHFSPVWETYSKLWKNHTELVTVFNWGQIGTEKRSVLV